MSVMNMTSQFDCLFNNVIGQTKKKNESSTLPFISEGNPSVTSGLSSRMASNTESIPMPWGHALNHFSWAVWQCCPNNHYSVILLRNHSKRKYTRYIKLCITLWLPGMHNLPFWTQKKMVGCFLCIAIKMYICTTLGRHNSFPQANGHPLCVQVSWNLPTDNCHSRDQHHEHTIRMHKGRGMNVVILVKRSE